MIIDDNYIIDLLWPKKMCLLTRCPERLTDDVKSYLLNRFKYSESIYETLFCIKHNIDRDTKICPVCGKGILKFNGNERNGYFIRGCSKKCIYILRNEKSKNTSLMKYGTTYPTQNKQENINIVKKRKQTCLERYGVECIANDPEFRERKKQKCLEKYGVEYAFQSDEVKEKIKQTCLERYGTNWTFQDDLSHKKHKETLLAKYGVENSFLIPDVVESFKIRKTEIQQKRENTKRKNKTFGASYPENRTYKLLISLFNENDVIRQYKEERYPYNCDFYIKSLDLFIECNYFWTHHTHFFNKENEEDILELKRMINLSETKPFYKNAITVWTKTDLEKRNIALQNNLNYLVFWNIQDCIEWINTYKNEF